MHIHNLKFFKLNADNVVIIKQKNLIKQKFNNLLLQLALSNKHYQTRFITQLLNFWVLHINIFNYFM